MWQCYKHTHAHTQIHIHINIQLDIDIEIDIEIFQLKFALTHTHLIGIAGDDAGARIMKHSLGDLRVKLRQVLGCALSHNERFVNIVWVMAHKGMSHGAHMN